MRKTFLPVPFRIPSPTRFPIRFLCLVAVSGSLAVPVGAQPTAPAAPVAPVARLDKQPPDSPERLEMLKVQVLLDRSGFRPGKIDGLGGEFTQKAADRYNTARDQDPGSRLDTSTITDPLTTYTVTEEDLKWIGKVASTPAEQEKLKRMPYSDAREMVAEKFHCDLSYFAELNPGVTTLAAGTEVRVPNVEPFRMEDVIALNDRRKEEEKRRKAEAEAAKAAAASPSPYADASAVAEATPSPEPTPEPAPERRIVILRDARLIEVFEGDRLIASYPCTPGSDRVPVPVGTWKITSNILMPYFRYDKSVLKDGTRSDNAFNIPPGPNSYVGIVWMGINRPSVGIHGTQHPDQIGRNQSSGCIRLANWDAFALTQQIEKGTAVEVR